MAKIILPPSEAHTDQQPTLVNPRCNVGIPAYGVPQTLDVNSAEDAWLTQIMIRLDRTLGLILGSDEDVQTRQQQLIGLLMDVLQQQPDPPMLDLIIYVLGCHGIGAYHYVPRSRDNVQLPYHRSTQKGTSNMRGEHCFVRMGPLVVELLDDNGYSDLLRGARDLCRLKHTHVSVPTETKSC